MVTKYERTGLWTVKMSSYCGMSHVLCEGEDLETAKEKVRRFLRRKRKQGYSVTKIDKGEFEINQEDGAMVSDDEGILSVRPEVRRYRRLLGRKFYID